MWVEIWTRRLSPLVKWGDAYLSVPTRYQILDKLLTAAPDAYKRDLFGFEIIAGAPDEWFEMVALHHLPNITANEWKAMSLDERGKHLAFLRLRNMVSVIERHMELQARERKRLEDEAAQGSDSGSGKKGKNRKKHAAD